MSSATQLERQHVEQAARSPARTLRWRLFTLTAGGLLPLVIAAALGTAYLVQERQQDAQRSALEISRALATGVNSELRSTVIALQSLALSESLTLPAPDQFHKLARRIASQQGWRSILLADTEGRIVLSTLRSAGEAVPAAPLDPVSMQRVLVSRAPVIGRVVEGKQLPGTGFAVRVPVFRDGQLVNVLSAVVNTDRMLDVLTRQNVPPAWVVTIWDQEGIRVARTRFNASTRPSPTMQALLDTGAEEGMGSIRTLEDVPSLTGFKRLKDSGWAVAVGIPASEVRAALWPLLLTLGGGLLASLVLSGYLAWVYAKRVSQPIQTLKSAAEALGRGDRVALPALGISELNEVGSALSRASTERDAALAERRASEVERERLLDAMGEALRLAQEAGRRKDEFLAVLGHELRNPLAPISAALQLMEIKADVGTRSEREILQRQLAHMVRLVDDLLDVSRITSKRLAIRLEPLLLSDVIGPVLDAIRRLLGNRRLEVHIAPDAACAWVRGDEVRLAQVLNNLLVNALKFTTPTGCIALSVGRRSDEIVIEVSDDGIGMSPAVLEHVFDPFFQAPQEMDRARGGLGLGLAIVKSLVELHGGSVRARSAGPGRGATFTVTLRRIEQPALKAPDTSVPESAPGKGKVLVVDDNQDAADSIAALLQLAGYEVRVAYDPAVALELVSAFSPDAAVLDIGLPGMSGYELAAALRSPSHGFTGFLVALTGYGEQKDAAQALQSGFDAHLTKPAETHTLLALLAARIRVPEDAAHSR